MRVGALAAALCLLAGTALAANATAAEASLLAPASVCPDQATTAPATAQEQEMRCLTDFARRARGLAPLADAADLDRSAAAKSADIIRCDSFGHEACGREFTFWMRRDGYLRGECWRVGENIAWGGGQLGSARSIFGAWLHSQGHRENILGAYAQIGVGLAVGTLDGYAGAHVWTQHFGSRC